MTAVRTNCTWPEGGDWPLVSQWRNGIMRFTLDAAGRRSIPRTCSLKTLNLIAAALHPFELGKTALMHIRISWFRKVRKHRPGWLP